MKFRPSKCPGLVLVPTDELNLGAFDRSKGRGYVLMQDRCFLTWGKPDVPRLRYATACMGPYRRMRAVSEQLAASEIDWTTDVSTCSKRDRAFGERVGSLIRKTLQDVNERFDRGEQR